MITYIDNNIIRNILREELLKEANYPSSFNMEEFKNLDTFSARSRYCNEHLFRITSGTGREIFKIDNNTVLKLAKNRKGIAQNEVESEEWKQEWYDIIARVYDYDEDGTYLEMELAQKVSPAMFRSILGFDYRLLDPYLVRQTQHESRWYGKISDENIKMLNKHWWINELLEFINGTGAKIGDLVRINSYGLVNRDG